MIILDSSAAIEIMRQTPEGQAFMSFILKDEETISCDLFRAEVASAARKFTRTKSFTNTQALNFMNETIDLVDDFAAIDELQDEALAESIRLDHSVYDMFYFVLARRSGGTLITMDRPLMRLCEQHGVDCVHEIDF